MVLIWNREKEISHLQIFFHHKIAGFWQKKCRVRPKNIGNEARMKNSLLLPASQPIDAKNER